MTNLLSSGRRNPKDLRPHPLNDEIYGDRTDPDLIKSIKEKGILNPLLITHDNRIISGHRRWGSSMAIGLDAVPVIVFGSIDDLDIEEALIESNRQRDKTTEQRTREYTHLGRIINERESRQGARNDVKKPDEIINKTTSVVQTTEVKRPTQKAAEMVGMHRATATKAAAVVKAIDNLKAEGKTAKADQVRKKLNTNVNAAYNQAKSEGILLDKKPAPATQGSYDTAVSVSEWTALPEARRKQIISEANPNTKYGWNETNDNVEWALWTWNPVTGCLHNCSYCYARDIANHKFVALDKFGDRFSPVFYPDRLYAPSNAKQPDLSQVENPIRRMGLGNVFVCSMADLFGKWVPSEWIEAVLQQAWDNPQWNFLFLTKFPIRMAEFEYPPNTWIGTTVDTQYAVERAEKAFTKVRASGYKGVAWLSCEPMMEKLTFTSLEMFDWVVMGGASKSSQTPEFRPPFDWIVHLWQQAKALDLPVYMKTNLWLDDAYKGIDIPSRVREYPTR